MNDDDDDDDEAKNVLHFFFKSTDMKFSQVLDRRFEPFSYSCFPNWKYLINLDFICAEKQTDKQTDRQTDIQTYIRTLEV